MTAAPKFRQKIASCRRALVGNAVLTVIAEARDGRRWQHCHVFKTDAAAEALAAKVMQHGSISEDHWQRLPPREGSAAAVALRALAASERLRRESVEAERRLAA